MTSLTIHGEEWILHWSLYWLFWLNMTDMHTIRLTLIWLQSEQYSNDSIWLVEKMIDLTLNGHAVTNSPNGRNDQLLFMIKNEHCTLKSCKNQHRYISQPLWKKNCCCYMLYMYFDPNEQLLGEIQFTEVASTLAICPWIIAPESNVLNI